MEESSCFYMCRSCRNQVLSSENFIIKDSGLRAIIGKNAVNVRAGDLQISWLCPYPVVDVSCGRCGKNLGYKFAKVAKISRVIKEGNFILYENQMLYWDGKQVLYADTQQPVEGN